MAKITLRKIVVDGEKWKWAVKGGKTHWLSEYTPIDEPLVVTLQHPDGYRREYDGRDVSDDRAITPGAVAEFIRGLKKAQ